MANDWNYFIISENKKKINHKNNITTNESITPNCAIEEAGNTIKLVEGIASPVEGNITFNEKEKEFEKSLEKFKESEWAFLFDFFAFVRNEEK